MSAEEKSAGLTPLRVILRRFAGYVGELIVSNRHSGNQTQLRGRAYRVGEIGKSLTLVGAIVNRIRSGCRGTEAEIGVRVDSGQIVTELSLTAAKLETWLHGVPLTAVNSEFVERIVASVLGTDFDYA